MKPYPRYDFPVSIRHHVYEVQNYKVASFFQGIYDVVLNFSMTITFVPKAYISDVDWRLYQADILDQENVKNCTEARLSCIANSYYSVTPDLSMPGQEKLLPQFFPEIPSGVVFLVNPKEFEIFSKEIAFIYEELASGGAYAYRTISELKDFAITKFLLDKVIISQHLLEHHLRILGR